MPNEVGMTMGKIDIILWVMGTGFSFIVGLLVIIRSYIGCCFDRLNN